MDDSLPNGGNLLPCMLQGENVGAFAEPPPMCITDVHRRAMELVPGGRVMILYIDGLGYDLYRRADLPFIRSTFACSAARSVIPPLTQPCMASMLTGEMPDVHGIFSRRDHRPKAPSLLCIPGSVLIEADCEPLALEHPPILTLPEPGETVDGVVLHAAPPLFPERRAAADRPFSRAG